MYFGSSVTKLTISQSSVTYYDPSRWLLYKHVDGHTTEASDNGRKTTCSGDFAEGQTFERQTIQKTTPGMIITHWVFLLRFP